jgi:alpha-mannosidase
MNKINKKGKRKLRENMKKRKKGKKENLFFLNYFQSDVKKKRKVHKITAKQNKVLKMHFISTSQIYITIFHKTFKLTQERNFGACVCITSRI